MDRETWLFISVSVIAFLVAFIVLRHALPQGIILYQGMSLGVVIAGAQFALSRCVTASRFSTSVKDALVTILLIYSFVLTVPTTVDRSYTVKLLRYLSESPDGVSRKQIEQFYVSDFIEHGAIEKRLYEQQATGTIVEQNGMFFLTRPGVALDWTFQAACAIFSCQHSSDAGARQKRH